MNHQFPSVKTYSTKWQRSYRLHHEKDKLFDSIQTNTTAQTGKDLSQAGPSGVKMKISSKPRSRLGSRDSVRTQSTQKSPRRVIRPVTVTSLPYQTSTSPRAITTPLIRRSATVSQKSVPTSPLITKPLRRYGVPTISRPDVKRSMTSKANLPSADPAHSQPKTLCVETLLKYRPEHAEKAYCKNDSYIHAWLRGVEEARGHTGKKKYRHDSESSIELLREAEPEHPELARKNSASELLKDMMNAFKSSSLEKSSELSNLKEQPSLPEKQSSPTAAKLDGIAEPDQETKRKQQKTPSHPSAIKKSRIPCLSRTFRSTKTSTCDGSGNQASTPTVTRTNGSSSHTYTYRWTMGSSSAIDETVTQEKTNNGGPESPTICIANLKGHKKLNSTTKPKAKSLGKVEFSQCLSPIFNETQDLQKSVESTPDTKRKRSSHNKENVVPRKQRCLGSKKAGKLAPKASTVLFTSLTINTAPNTPDVSSIRFDKEQMPKPVEPFPKVVGKSFDFDAAEKESQKESDINKECDLDDENKENLKPPVLGPVITSTPDSQHKYIRHELMLLADLSSVAPPSPTEDDLIPLRRSGFEVNSDEIMCASDLDLEVDVPQIQEFAYPEPSPDESGHDATHKETPTPDSTYIMTPSTSASAPHQKHIKSKKLKTPKFPVKASTHFEQTQTGTKKQESPKHSQQSKGENIPSKQKKTGRLKKLPSRQPSVSKKYCRVSTVSNSSSKRRVSESGILEGRPRWKYFSRLSTSFSGPNLPLLDRKKAVHPKKTSKIPPCSLVALQRCHPSSLKSTVQFSVRTTNTKLVTDETTFPPDDIMTTARKLAKIKHQVES